MTATGVPCGFHEEVAPELDLEVWIKFGPPGVKRRVFTHKEERKLRHGSIEAREVCQQGLVHSETLQPHHRRWGCWPGA